MNEDVILVDIIKEVVSSMSISCNFIAGRNVQIVEGLLKIDNSVTNKLQKYPLIALVTPIKETRTTNGYYADVKIPRIVIAVKSLDKTASVLKRYENGGTFKSSLYPIYYEFLKKLAHCRWILNSDPDNFPHKKMDNPGIQPASESMNDYVDCIEIFDLEFKINQLKTC